MWLVKAVLGAAQHTASALSRVGLDGIVVIAVVIKRNVSIASCTANYTIYRRLSIVAHNSSRIINEAW